MVARFVTITLPDDELGIEAIRSAIVREIITRHCEELQIVSPAQAAGILDISIKSLWDIPDLPRIEISTKLIRYRLSDLRAWLAKHRRLPGEA